MQRNKKQSENHKKTSEEKGKKSEEDLLLGTAKSIDITLNNQKRLEARRNKFSAPALGPSSLIQKIQRSQKEAKKKLESKQEISEKEEVKKGDEEKTKKFFSDFTADSDPE